MYKKTTYRKINKDLKRDSPNQIEMNQLIEYFVDKIRVWPKPIRGRNCKILIEQIIMWSTYSNAEAVGTLEMIKQQYVQLELTKEEEKD